MLFLAGFVPGWKVLYPVVVYLPAALLLIAPVFVVLGLAFKPPKATVFFDSALIIMVLGTVSIFLVLETGEAAAAPAITLPHVKRVLEQYQEIGRATGALFAVFTVAFTPLVLFSSMLRGEVSRKLSTAMFLAFLLLYSSGALFLANTSYQGGRLAHEINVSARLWP
jgi:uncharacterized membrane protein